jgi:hypothetical protein
MPHSRQPYRRHRIYVASRLCDTCIFRPGNLMQLEEGRVEEMVREACAKETAIICHETLSGDKAICRGFFEQHPTLPLILADRLGRIKFQESK